MKTLIIILIVLGWLAMTVVVGCLKNAFFSEYGTEYDEDISTILIILISWPLLLCGMIIHGLSYVLQGIISDLTKKLR